MQPPSPAAVGPVQAGGGLLFDGLAASVVARGGLDLRVTVLERDKRTRGQMLGGAFSR